MSEKFFYRENPVNSQRINLKGDYIKALLGDVTPPVLPELRNTKKQSS